MTRRSHKGSPSARERADWSVDELTARLQVGGPAELGELYDRYSGRAFRVALSICHEPRLAEEVVQDAFVSIYRARSTYRTNHGSAASGVMRITYERSLERIRADATSASSSAEDNLVGLRSSPGRGRRTAVALGHRFRTRLGGLPDPQREVITLAFYGELSRHEIARELELPVATVTGRIHAGMHQLHRGLGSEQTGSDLPSRDV